MEAFQGNKRSLQLIFNGWREHTDVKRAEKLIYSQATVSSCTLLKRRFFNQWLRKLDINHQIAKLDATALHQWAYNQLLKAWVEWRNQLQLRISLHQRMHVLICNHQIRSLRSCWNGWTLYVETKKRNNGVAEEQFNLSVMTKYFNQWLKRHKRVQEIALFHEQLAHKERLARLQRVFIHWKHYIIIKHYYRGLNELSNQYYARKSKVLVFKGLRLFANLKQQKEIFSAQAVKHRRSMLLNFFWQCWIRRCEYSEEIKMLPQIRLAFNHFRKVMLMQFIAKWEQYVIWRRHCKEKYCIADKHFNNKIILKAFSAFRQNVKICEYKQHILTAAYNFRRENLLSMVFYYWWRSCVHHQDMRMMERMAILHNEETIKKNILTIWRLKTKLTLESSDLQRRADDQSYYRVMSKMLCRWKLFCQLSQHKKGIKFKATICYELKLLRLAWDGWEKYLHQQKTKYQQWQKASDHHSLMLMKKVFRGYKCYHKRQLIKKDLTTQAISFYRHHILRSLCKSWKLFVLRQQALRSMKIQASLYYNGKIIDKAWTNWKYAKRYQSSLRELEGKKVVHFQKKLEYSYTMRAFFTWKYHKDQRIVNRFKWERSVSLYRQTILHKYFNAWSQYSHLRGHKLSLKQSSSWFYINRLKAACYSHWRLQLMRILIQRQKNTLALWQWSQTLQQKVMCCWLEYTEYRKQRHKRYDDAMGYYRKILLSIGITEWIRVATWQATRRQERAIEKQTKNVQSTIMCVRRCAQHWRKWAHKRKSSLDQWQHCDNSNNGTKNSSSLRAINGMNTEWISIIKQKKRPQPRKPKFLTSDNFIDCQGIVTLQNIAVEHSSLNATESVESVPRKEVFPLSHPSIIQHKFAFLPSSPSEASLIAVNSTEDQQLLDLCTKRKDLSRHSFKQSAIIPLPPSAFELKHTNSSEHFPLQTDKPAKQQKLSSEEILKNDQPIKQQKEFQDQVSQSVKHEQSISELSAIDIQLKNLTLNQEILCIKRFLERYHSVKEKLRIIEDKIKTAENSPHGTLKQLQEEQATISSALELHKPLMLRMVARSNELKVHYQYI